jgi:hypothetical protein
MALDARVYVDESYSVKDEVFYLAALIVPTECEAALEAAWNELRIEIKNEIQDYYGAQKHKDDPDWLPELHAESLYQSQDEYEKYYKRGKNGVPENDKDYWKKHSDWLEKALLIQAQFELPLIVIKGLPHMSKAALNADKYLDEMLKGVWNSDIPEPLELHEMYKKMRDLETRAFTWFFPNLLFHIENELAAQGWQAEIICDDEEDQRGFRLSTLLKDFHENKILAHVKSVEFEDSRKWSGLQVVDIHAYILRRAEALEVNKIQNPKPTDARLQTWASAICRKQLIDNQLQIVDQVEKTMPLIFEYIIMNCGGPIALRQNIWASVRKAFKKHSQYVQ